jgi:Flp pilus assembly protein TadD
MTMTRAKALGLLLLVLAVGMAVYYPALHRAFVYDDILTVRDNDFIAHPTNLLHLWGTGYLTAAGEQSYRPVLTASYLIDHMIWGAAPFGYSLTNLLFHIVGAWLFGVLLWSWFPQRGGFAAVAALLYLLSPALSETVISPGHREQVFSVMWMMLGANAWTQGRAGRAWLRWLSPVFFFVACLTLEWSVVAPFALASWAWLSGGDWRRSLRETWREFAAIGLYLALYVFVLPREKVEVEWIGGGPLGGLWNFGPLVFRYARLALLPLKLRPNYTFAATPPRLALAMNVALWTATAAALIGLLRRKPWALGIGLFIGGLLPVGHVLEAFWIPVAERYLALPLLGGLPLLAAALTANRRRWALLPALAIFFAWGALGRAHALDWRDGRTLWGRAVTVEPGDPTSWTNFAAGLASNGDREGAVRAHAWAWDAARRAGVEVAQHPLNLAQALAMTGRVRAACELLAGQAPRFRLDRDWLLAAGRLCATARPKFASDVLAMIVSRDPTDGEAWAEFCAGDPARAEACVRAALQQCPDDGRLWLRVAAIHAARGDFTRARQAIGAALQSPQADEVKDTALALLLHLKKREREAIVP